MEMLTP